MTNMPAAPADDLLVEKLDHQQFVPKQSRSLLYGMVALLVIVLAAGLLVSLALRAKETQFHNDLERRLGILATGRVELVTAWLNNSIRVGNRDHNFRTA